MDVPNKRYYIEKLQILKYYCEKQRLYTSVTDSHMENSKIWNWDFSCRALRPRCDDVLYTTKFTVPIFAVFHV